MCKPDLLSLEQKLMMKSAAKCLQSVPVLTNLTCDMIPG